MKTTYYPDGSKKSEGPEINGIPNGVWRGWHPNGALHYEEEFKNGRRSGRITYWHPNGQIFGMGAYRDDQRAGYWVWFYPDGMKKEEGLYIVGKLHGIGSEWHSNGELAAEGCWMHGVEDGTFSEWNAEGKLLSQKYFEMGVRPYALDEREPSLISELKAAPGKFRIVGIDQFNYQDHWVIGDYDRLLEAMTLVKKMTERARPLASHLDVATVYYIYDDEGRYLWGDLDENN